MGFAGMVASGSSSWGLFREAFPGESGTFLSRTSNFALSHSTLGPMSWLSLEMNVCDGSESYSMLWECVKLIVVG